LATPSDASRNEIYVGMNPVKEGCRTRTKADIAEIRHIYLDFDANGTAAVNALSARTDVPQPNYLLNTSPDIGRLSGKSRDFGAEDAERLMRNLVRESGRSCATDSSRVLRLPGFISYKHTSPFVVRVENKTAETYRPEHFRRIRSRSRAAAG